MKNRIKYHKKVKAKDLVPHELNPRVHNDTQREALKALFGEIGFARSLLAYELPDGRLKLIDGHLRQNTLGPEEEIDVEVLDVNDAEARKLLLSLDPLAQLADFDDKQIQALKDSIETDSAVLEALWDSLKQKDEQTLKEVREGGMKNKQVLPEKFMVMIECQNEKHQVELLRKFKAAGLDCRAITS